MTLRDRHLVLFLTSGMSLAGWQEAGILARETAIYRRLRPELAGVTMVTYGGAADTALAGESGGFDAKINRLGLPQRFYAPYVARFWRPPVPAIIKSNQVSGSDLALAVARRCKLPFLCRLGYPYSLNSEAELGHDSAQARYARALEKQVFAGADLIAVTTPFIRDAYIERYQLPPAKVRVLPNYVDTDLFQPAGPGEAGEKRVAFVGRFSREKNLPALLEALAGLDAELWLIGSGPDEAALRAQVAAMGIRARFLGRLAHADVAKALRQCQVFALPSHYEGQPKVMLEAMAAGLAVLGTDVRGIRDVVRHDDTGLLCATDAASLRQGLRALLRDGGLRARLGRRAREQVLDEYALTRVTELELGLLRELAA